MSVSNRPKTTAQFAIIPIMTAIMKEKYKIHGCYDTFPAISLLTTPFSDHNVPRSSERKLND